MTIRIVRIIILSLISLCPPRQPPELHTMNLFRSLAFALFSVSVLAGSALAAEPEVRLVIKNHQFEPAELEVPAGQRVKLVVHNQDSTAEEFESHDLNREKIVPPGAKATIFIGPLKPGRYAFVGEYHEATAKGVVVAK